MFRGRISALAVLSGLIALCYALDVDIVDAATTSLNGGADKGGEGVNDAGSTVMTMLITILGPIAAVGGGVGAGVAANRAGGSAMASAGTGVGTAVVLGFIPIAATTTYTTSGSEGASLLGDGSWAASVGLWNDATMFVYAAILFLGLTLYRDYQQKTLGSQ